MWDDSVSGPDLFAVAAHIDNYDIASLGDSTYYYPPYLLSSGIGDYYWSL